MRVHVTGAALSLLGVALFASVAPAGRAMATPQQATHIYRMTCNSAGVEVMFLLPSALDAQSALVAQGVSGSVDAVWIDLSLVDNNFLSGSFVAIGPFLSQSDGHAVFWNGLLPGKQHFYRFNALVGERWVQVGAGFFETPDCDVVTQISCDSAEALINKVRFNLAAWRPKGLGPPPDKDHPVEWLDLTLWYDFFEGSSVVGTPIHTPTTLEMNILPGLRHFYRRNVLGVDGRWYAQWRGTFLSLRCDRLPHTILPTDLG